MTNPHATSPTGIDIRASADMVIARIHLGEPEDALRLLQRMREAERPTVQEALDRYVAVGAREELDRLRRSGAPEDAGGNATVLARLQLAMQSPRMPEYSRNANEPNEFVGLSRAQVYDIYASMVETRGDHDAPDALRLDNHVLLLALRRENSTLISMDGSGRAGTGIYNDRIVALIRGPDGERSVFVADRANTEPTAQYSHHAGSDGTRRFSNMDIERREIPSRTGYEDVRPRKIQGKDVDGDTMRDLGRLAEGTVEMGIAEHGNPRFLGTRAAFRPSQEQLAPERVSGMVQRDTNGDGYFTATDNNGLQDLNPTFKIHSGSRGNTDSAGCLTIHPDDYRAFVAAARSNAAQTRWQLVLTSTEGGLFHNVEVGGDRAQPAPGPQRPDSNAPDGDPQANLSPRRGPFGDPALDRYYAAVLAGDGDLADRIAIDFAQSAPGQRMTHRSDQLLAEQQAREVQVDRQSSHVAPSREDAVLQA